MYSKLTTTTVKINGDLCICKNIRVNNKTYVASIQIDQKIILFPDTMIHIGCDAKDDVEDMILSTVGWNHVKRLSTVVMDQVVVTRVGTVLVINSTYSGDLFTYAARQRQDPITYINELRSSGAI